MGPLSRATWVLAVLVAAGLSVGCGGGSVASVSIDQAFAVDNKQVFLVKDFDTAESLVTGDNADKPAVVTSQRERVKVDIRTSMVMRLQNKGYTARAFAEGDKPVDALVIDGKVPQINNGSGAARAIWGFGAGAAWIKATVRIYKAGAPTDLLAEFVAEGSSGGSASWADMTRANADEIAEAVMTFLAKKHGGR
jgi:hypothetical protein